MTAIMEQKLSMRTPHTRQSTQLRTTVTSISTGTRIPIHMAKRVTMIMARNAAGTTIITLPKATTAMSTATLTSMFTDGLTGRFAN
jgi:hypothetical protein